MKKFLLIDAFGLIFKAYYAFINRPLTNRNGENTSSIFGFFKSLLSILKKENPDYYLVALEGEGECFRNQIYPLYKANRQPAPDDLKTQIPKIIKLMEKLEIPFLYKDGYEADDIIGTISEKFIKEEDKKAIIVSSDKDLRQLINEKVYIYSPGKTTDDFELYNIENFYEKAGIKPEQIPDYLALIGDSVDNIPGVKGIGPKTAIKLLNEYKNIEEIYENIDKIIPESLKNKLIIDKENAFLSKKLATIKKDIPVELDWERWKVHPFNLKEAIQLLEKDSLKTIIEAIEEYNSSIFKTDQKTTLFDSFQNNEITPSTTSITETKVLSREYKVITNFEALYEKIKKIKEKKVFCFDIETTGFDFFNDKIISLSFAIDEDVFIVPLNLSKKQQDEISLSTDEKYNKKIIEILKLIFEDNSILKIGHNLKFDVKFLKGIGIEPSGNFFDTMIAEYCLDAAFNIFNMDDLALKYLNYKTIHYNEVVKDTKKQTLQDVSVNALAKYSGEDADITFQLYKVLKEKIESNESTKNLFYNIEMPLVDVLIDMEYTGVRIDSEYLNKLSKEFEKSIEELTEKLTMIAGESFNPNSPKQVAEILYNKLKLPILKKTKTALSTDMEVLEKLSYIHPIASTLLELRTITKLKSTYTDSLPELINPKTKKIHTTYMQTGTQTGRLSSKNPNLQNIPVKTELGRKIRSAFIPSEDNILISADYSQIELFLLAEFSKDKNLCEAFKTGIDIHKKTASIIFNKTIDEVTDKERSIGKTINFSILYGQGPHRLSENLNITRSEASNFINIYFASYNGVARYMNEIKEKAKKTGYATTFWGRKRTIPEILDKNKTVVANGERIAVNTTIQGSAADMIKISMIKIFENFKKENLKSKLIMQVHDELIFDVDKKEKDKVVKIIKESMEEGFPFELKPHTSIQEGKNWGEIQ